MTPSLTLFFGVTLKLSVLTDGRLETGGALVVVLRGSLLPG